MCVIIIFNPTYYAKSCLNGISVWAFKVLPLLFPFFVLTKLINNLSNHKKNSMDKLFCRIYNTPNGSLSTFILSALSGYPMGAKLICDMHKNKQISSEKAQKMLSFCSISGPMFMIGTVGVSMLSNFRAGVIILISNILASLINGLLYRGKTQSQDNASTSFIKNQVSLSECVYDSLISILMVGAYIVLSFILLDMLKILHITELFSNAICGVFNINRYHNVVSSVFNGFFEITRGIYDLSLTGVSLKLKTILSSFLVGFGGFSIMLQSFSFIEKIEMPFKKMLIQKTTQSILSLIISIPFSLLILN